MNTPRTPPARAEVTEVLDAKPPAKLSKLSLAMQVVTRNIETIESFDAEVAALVADNPKDRIYDVTSKAGKKAADDTRANARAKRLAINNMVKDGKKVLTELKDELVAAAERHVPTLQAIEDNAKTQLESAARAEADRIARHENAIGAISRMAEGAATMSSEELSQRILDMEKVIVDDSYEEYQERAATVRAAAVAILAEAKGNALLREHAARQAAELETKRAAWRAAVDAIKNLPDQVTGTGIENVREALRIHEASVPAAEAFGEMFELAELAHFKTTNTLKTMVDELVAAEILTHQPFPSDSQWTPEQMDEIAAKGEPPLALNSIPQAGDEPIDDANERSLQIVTQRTPAADPDPFEPAPAPPRPRPVMRAVSTPASTPAPAPEPAPAADVPDLLKAVRNVLEVYDRITVPGFESPLAVVLHGPFGEAMKDLRAAFDFTNEFAD